MLIKMQHGHLIQAKAKMKKTIIYGPMIMITIMFALGYKIPLGLTGTVYDLKDNPVNASISIHDINSSFFVEGTVRKDGSYAVAIDGNSGDTIIVKSRTQTKNVTRTVILEGVLHDFDLYLNLSEAEQPVVTKTLILKNPIVITGQVAENIDYEIKNLETNEVVYGKTQDYGIYVDVISGKIGDNIEIKLSDSENTKIITTKIEGDMVFENIKWDQPKLGYIVLLILLTLPFIVRIYRVFKK